MIAGTIALLDAPAGEPLSDTVGSRDRPALSVKKTQRDLAGEAIAQHGSAVGTVSITTEDVTVMEDDGDVTIITEEFEGREEHLTDWTADVTGRGVVVVESLGGTDAFAFPLNVIASQTDQRPRLVEVDIEGLARDWGDVEAWYVGATDGDEKAALTYHEAATAPEDATVGLGFTRTWQETAVRGVIYESGYIAVYSAWTHAVFLEFLADAVLPYAHPIDDVQTTLGGDQ